MPPAIWTNVAVSESKPSWTTVSFETPGPASSTVHVIRDAGSARTSSSQRASNVQTRRSGGLDSMHLSDDRRLPLNPVDEGRARTPFRLDGARVVVLERVVGARERIPDLLAVCADEDREHM